MNKPSLILTGGWIESMHFSVMAQKSKPSDQIKFRIAEQKQALTSLIKILGSNSSAEITELVTMMSDLAKVYDAIQFKYVFVAPVTDTIKKVTYINSTTEVTITEEQLGQISTKVEAIRNKVVNTQS